MWLQHDEPAAPTWLSAQDGWAAIASIRSEPYIELNVRLRSTSSLECSRSCNPISQTTFGREIPLQTWITIIIRWNSLWRWDIQAMVPTSKRLEDQLLVVFTCLERKVVQATSHGERGLCDHFFLWEQTFQSWISRLHGRDGLLSPIRRYQTRSGQAKSLLSSATIQLVIWRFLTDR